MKKIFLLLTCLFHFSATVAEEITVVNPTLDTTIPIIAATSYVLQDFYSGQILLEKDADIQVDPASLTKIMTAYIVFEKLHKNQIQLTDEVQISEKAWRSIGSRMYLEVATKVSVDLLLKGMIIQSGNDAAIALAEHIAGSEEKFVVMMNEYAQKLGLTHTHYVNSTGFTVEGHYSTARDLGKIASILIHDFPEYYRLYSEKEFTYDKVTQNNRNLLLWRDKSVDGLKTGYTEAAGYCLIASAKRGGMRLISVIMGTKSKTARADESEKLLNYGFNTYETYQLYQAKEILNKDTVWQGATSTVELGLMNDLYVTVPKGQYSGVTANLYLDKQIIAPVKTGQQCGKLRLNLAGKLLAEYPVIALHDVEVGNIFQQAIDFILLQF